MPLINQTFEYLPDIDAAIPDSTLDAIKAQLQSSMPASASSTQHPSLPPAYEPAFSPLMQVEHARIAAAIAAGSSSTKMRSGIDMSRYEAVSAPEDGSAERWTQTLSRASTAHTYLSIRSVNLGLLEEYGKNAWLIGNAGLEGELGMLEKELAERNALVQGVEEERRAARSGVAAEFEILGESWRVGIGRALETEIAAEELRRTILEKRKGGAVNGD